MNGYLYRLNAAVILVVALGISACGSQEEPAAEVAEDPSAAAVEEGLIDEATAAVEETTDVANDTIEIVEESAAEPASDEEEIKLAMATTPTESAPRDWQFKEGENYARLVPTQPTVGGADKIEVAEFFWYGCPSCYDFEPFIKNWKADLPANARFVKIPGMWNPLLVLHARLYYTEEVLVRNGTIKDGDVFREAVFQEYHRRNNRMASESSIKKVFERFGVSGDEFDRTWNSFEVNQKLSVAEDLARRYGISGVPTIVVNGKYRTGAREAGGYDKLIELIDELIVRESIR